MIALDRLRQQGFDIRPTDNGIYIDPIDSLRPEQRLWIVNNKPQIRDQLLAERWQWFLSLAVIHGINPNVAGAEFPTDNERLRVVEPLEHSDELLRECMATLCRDAIVIRRQREYEAGRSYAANPFGDVIA